MRRYNCKVVFTPSYWHWSITLTILSNSLGLRTVMMNESHAGTERAKGWKRSLKRLLVARFHAALVGGTPHKLHFTALGMDPEKIFSGYDTIDNDFFASEAARVREDPEAWRTRLGLPPRYILSLGRMVEKKNLGCLIEAYAQLQQDLGDDAPALVFVGSGDQESALRRQCAQLGLQVADASEVGGRRSEVGEQPAHQPGTKNQEPRTQNQERGEAAIYFAGFRQIEENPAFYALADCFVLPSLYEEWGLVVNEAMACGLPVVVSKTVGSAEDLVRPGENGFHIDPTRPEQLTEALACLITDPELRGRMGTRSREIINQWGCDDFVLGAGDGIYAALGVSTDP
jgi:glycosyltransferase involved in cell wall biosynthesis